MPVRKIKKSRVTVTGLMYSLKLERQVSFESELELHYYYVLDTDPRVDSFEEQPLCIEYLTPEGKKRKYFPDVRVKHNDGSLPELVEIKSRRYLIKQFAKLKPKLKAARAYARENACKFKIITDQEIRSQYVRNIIFLRHFLKYKPNETSEELIITYLREAGEASPEEILTALTETEHDVAKLLPSIWRLVATARIQTDLAAKLTNKSMLYSTD